MDVLVFDILSSTHVVHSTADNLILYLCKLLDLLFCKTLMKSFTHPIFIFLNGPTPASFSFFGSFRANNTIFTANQCEKISCPFSIRHWDLNPQPLVHESSPITPLDQGSCPDVFIFLKREVPLRHARDNCTKTFSRNENMRTLNMIPKRMPALPHPPHIAWFKGCNRHLHYEEISSETYLRDFAQKGHKFTFCCTLVESRPLEASWFFNLILFLKMQTSVLTPNSSELSRDSFNHKREFNTYTKLIN